MSPLLPANLSSHLALPPYAPACEDAPSYSPQPADDERLIDQTPSSRPRVPTGTYMKTSGRDTLALMEQDETAEVPMYGREASINGCVSVDEREMVSEVTLKIKGQLDLHTSERGTMKTVLINDQHTLWSSHQSHTSACSSSIPFSVALPAKFQDDYTSHTLPPSYDFPSTLVPGLSVKSSYTISVVVIRVRKKRLLSLSTRNIISTAFHYYPRSRPIRPILHPTLDFLEDVKIMPAEWRQVVGRISLLHPVDVHVFIPAVEIFGLDDKIPFHVQLTGPIEALREFLPEPDAPRTTHPVNNTNTSIPNAKPTLEVTLLRQLVVGMAPRNITIGRASTFASCPPSIAHAESGAPQSDTQHASLDWDGELAIQCAPGTAVGSFDAGIVKVQDFIVLDVRPPTARVPFRLSRGVTLVTDSWVDSTASQSEMGRQQGL
ncbi:hypothetical protein C8J57DRAFT_1307026 [Mycena rebaudengoi]|nr:hypothetical protein C8J57DRAFT_1307026 [Mycena rebaudengoi]